MNANGFTIIELLVVTALSGALALGCFSFMKVQLHMGHAIHEKIQLENNWERARSRVQQILDEHVRTLSTDFVALVDNTLVLEITADERTRNCFGTKVKPSSLLVETIYTGSDRLMCRSSYTAINGDQKRDTQSIIDDVQAVHWSVTRSGTCSQQISLKLTQKNNTQRSAYWYLNFCFAGEMYEEG